MGTTETEEPEYEIDARGDQAERGSVGEERRMRLRQLGNRMALALAAACVLFSGCGGGSNTNVVTVSVAPPTTTIIVNQQQQFNATVGGATDTTVKWTLTISGKDCTPDCGTIDDPTKNLITYTAPAKVPAALQPTSSNATPPALTLTATSNANTRKTATATITLDSGIRVSISPASATIGTGESFPFTASTTNDTVLNDVTWLVTQATTITATSASCSPGCGSIGSLGNYTAPATVPSNVAVTVEAVSKVDTTRFNIATVTVVTAAPSAFTGIFPATAPQGALFQDVYLRATNLRSTSVISFNGVTILPPQLKVTTVTTTTTSGSTTTTTTSTSARIRLLASQLSQANTSPGFPIAIAGATGGPFNLQVVPVRPGLVSSGSDGVLQNSNSGQLTLNGGYFGDPSLPAVTPSFGGGTSPGPRSFSVGSARQLQVTLNPSDLSLPGLYSVSLQNKNGAAGTPALNLAVEPDPNTNGPSVTAMLPAAGSSTTPFNNPAAIALDSTLGYAIVANQGSNSVVRINTGVSPPQILATPITVGKSPTSVAVDEILHVAAVVNSGDKTISLVDLQTGSTFGSPIDVSGFGVGLTAPAGQPVSVGLEPNSQLGIVAFSSSNVGAIFHYEKPSPTPSTPTCLANTQGSSPNCVVSVVTLGTGANPQIAFHPGLHWGFVTPGGILGVMSVVDVTRPVNSVAIAAAPNGLSRSGNVVTVKTTTSHNLNPANPGTVLITGAADSSFNGAFTVTSVLDAQTFIYGQTASNAASGGGNVFSSQPLLTFSVGEAVRGIAINPQTQKAILTDPNSNDILFLSLLDQTVTPIFLTAGGASEIGATGAGYQPFTNLGVSVNPVRNELSVYDPVKPQRLGTPTPTQGNGSGAVAVDPATNLALVANATSNNISVIQLGSSFKRVHVSRWIPQSSVPASQILAAQTVFTSTSTTGLPITIFGSGFSGFFGTPTVRLDGFPIGTGTVVSDRRIDITVPASFLAVPRRFALDVAQSGGVLSNTTDFAVVESVNLTGTGCSAPQPFGVTIDDDRDLAFVTNNGCNNLSIIDLAPTSPTFGQVTQTVAVGTAPTGVAVSPRLGLAVVANSNFDIATGKVLGTGSATLIDLTQNPPKPGQPINTGNNPTGVAIDQDTGRAYVVNTGSNTLSSLDLNASTPVASSSSVDQQPISIAIDPDRQVALVGAVQVTTNPPTGVLDVVDISGAAPSRTATIAAFADLPTGIVFDPAASPTVFYAVSALGNSFVVANPDTTSGLTVRVGVNPTSLAYNYRTGTLLTVNTISNTLSIVDTQRLVTQETLSLGNPPASVGSTNPQFGVAIHPRTNLAVIADELNNRVLLYPVPR